ncbi:hypothetical protein B0J13DRAFT_579362 [Dactylonectria estremocensis]|uniref:Uncharacterized protein n=1 Tax=Dactylonectria estremocensis TaxID=1079267 RepID=A0A9P9I712_9HYPO|nr:hypothetical protein B0J13DRAFT_579362 [Dactylonectria estremocensis]
MPGFLVPDTYVAVPPSFDDLLVASIIWGCTLATGAFSGTKAVQQTWALWKRSRRIQPYVIMVWAEWIVNFVIGALAWVFLRGFIEPSFWIYFFFLVLWVIQIQCICGIIINRIGLLMIDKRNVAKIRWGVAIILGLINISGFIIWIPAQLQISEMWVHINHYYDRTEKAIFLVIDASLHLYFIYLVRVRLIANGLHKYTPLFRFNMFMVAISMSLDVILIGSMSIGNGFIYVQFHPLVYTIKLQIEMNISSLIVKVARATGYDSSYKNDYAQGTELQSKLRGNIQAAGSSGNQAGLETADQLFSSHNEAHIEADTSSKPASKGITKIVQTRVTVTSRHCEEEDEDGSSQSSTRHLKRSSQVYQDHFDEGMPTSEGSGITVNEAYV